MNSDDLRAIGVFVAFLILAIGESYAIYRMLGSIENEVELKLAANLERTEGVTRGLIADALTQKETTKDDT